MINKRAVKKILGELPLAPELYWRFVMRGRPLTKSLSLRNLERRLPEWRTQAAAAAKQAPPGKRILIFVTLRYWIEHSALLGMALAGLGHQVTFTYLPYPSFRKSFQRFDVRRQNAYARSVLEQAHPAMKTVSLLDVRPASPRSITPALFHALQEVAERDTQYSLQVEAVEREGDSPSARLYRLRLERNLQAAAALLGWIEALPQAKRPELILTPNGSILEMGAIYQTALALKIPVTTYEFGEQRGRIWFDQGGEVMHQSTDRLWDAGKGITMDEKRQEQIRALYASRRNGQLWENFSRLWQGQAGRGGEQARQALGLNERPVVLLAANVIGDSLTLGRQVFNRDMTDWLERSVQMLAARPDVQLLVRIHPGERYLKGPSVAQVVRSALADLPSHIHLIEAADPINTYDLIEIADLGLVYTTTVGMEMAMSGVPVLVGGQTHYRGKGFTLDPQSWSDYADLLDGALAAAHRSPGMQRLERPQVEDAWKYAYLFFFEYPAAFPWHLLDLWSDVERWPLERVLAEADGEPFRDTLHQLAGRPRTWAGLSAGGEEKDHP